MSRWSSGTWVMAAVAIDESGNIFPLSEVERRTGFSLKGYYSESFLIRGSVYYRMDDIVGEIDSKYEGSFTIESHLQIKDKNNSVRTLYADCDGYTCCGEDCYMLLILTLGNSAKSTSLDFQEVDMLELEEAVGKELLEEWMTEHSGESTLTELESPTF